MLQLTCHCTSAASNLKGRERGGMRAARHCSMWPWLLSESPSWLVKAPRFILFLLILWWSGRWIVFVYYRDQMLLNCICSLFLVYLVILLLFLLQKSMNCIDCVISREWIQLQELKFLTSSFYNIGVSLYNTNQLKKVPAFNCCCHFIPRLHCQGLTFLKWITVTIFLVG